MRLDMLREDYHRKYETMGDESQLEMLNVLMDGRRLRDISDLPFDLAV